MPSQKAGAVEEPVEKPGRMAEERGMFLQINVDAAEGDAIDALVLLVGPQRRVKRRKQGVFAEISQSGDQRVAVQATAAIHAAGPGDEIDDFHESRKCK